MVHTVSKQAGALAIMGLGILVVRAPVFAQLAEAAEAASAPRVASSTPIAPPALPKALSTPSFAPTWVALSVAQQESLRPLANTWDTLSDGHRRKWIAVAKNYPAMAEAERTKLHSRMVDWVALSPRDRELARLNFVETKKISPPDRALNWEAYQALSPEERQKLANKAIAKPKGAAATIKPTAVNALTPVPVTRHTPTTVREMEMSKQTIDRNTLLPIPIRPAPDASAPQN